MKKLLAKTKTSLSGLISDEFKKSLKAELSAKGFVSIAASAIALCALLCISYASLVIASVLMQGA